MNEMSALKVLASHQISLPTAPNSNRVNETNFSTPKLYYFRSTSKRELYLTDEELSKGLKRKSPDRMIIYFIHKMAVTKQFNSYGFMAYVAECGGFVGLFLGFSLLQLEQLFNFLETKVKRN